MVLKFLNCEVNYELLLQYHRRVKRTKQTINYKISSSILTGVLITFDTHLLNYTTDHSTWIFAKNIIMYILTYIYTNDAVVLCLRTDSHIVI